MIGSTHVESDRIKLGSYSLGKLLVSEVGTEVGSTDGFPGGNGDGKLED